MFWRSNRGRPKAKDTSSSNRPVAHFCVPTESPGGEISPAAICLEAWGRHSVLVKLREGDDSVGLLIWESVHKGEQRSRDSLLEFAVVPVRGDSVRVELRPRATHDPIHDQAPGGDAQSAPPLDEGVPLRVRLVDPTGEAFETSARRFTIASLAQGTAELVVWHEPSPTNLIQLLLNYHGSLPAPGRTIPTLKLWMYPIGPNLLVFWFRPTLVTAPPEGE